VTLWAKADSDFRIARVLNVPVGEAIHEFAAGTVEPKEIPRATAAKGGDQRFELVSSHFMISRAITVVAVQPRAIEPTPWMITPTAISSRYASWIHLQIAAGRATDGA